MSVLTNQETTLLFFLVVIIVIWIAMLGAYIKLVRQPNIDQGNRPQINEDIKHAVQTVES